MIRSTTLIVLNFSAFILESLVGVRYKKESPCNESSSEEIFGVLLYGFKFVWLSPGSNYMHGSPTRRRFRDDKEHKRICNDQNEKGARAS